MLEFALVSVILFSTLFGLIEGGLLVRARNAVDNATDEGARRAAVAVNDPTADWQILRQIKSHGATVAATIDRVIVFRATDTTSVPHPDCLLGVSVPDECNVYDTSAFDLPQTAFGCTGVDSSWCPETRGNSDPGEVLYVGVYIQARHQSVTGFLGTFELESRSGLPIEGTGRL